MIEKIAAWIPFAPKIDVRDVARAMRLEAEMRLKDENLGHDASKYFIYEHKDLEKMLL